MKSSRRMYAVLQLLLLLPVVFAFGSDSTRRAARFEDMYECHIITDIEVSEYTADDYEEVDCEALMHLLARGRFRYISFYPAWEANLYDDEGIRYKLYISKSGTFFRVDSDCFQLSTRRRNKLLRLLEASR